MNSFMNTHEELKDLVIFDQDTGDTIDRFSAEHITYFGMARHNIMVRSSQRTHDTTYPKDKVGFYFEGR